MSEIENQETELHNDVENEVVSEAQEPKGSGDVAIKPEQGKDAEKASFDSVDKAGEATKKAPARKGDKSNSEPMPKTKAGIINAMYSKLSGMKKRRTSSCLWKIP